jgi:hypothetical protein
MMLSSMGSIVLLQINHLERSSDRRSGAGTLTRAKQGRAFFRMPFCG